MMLIWDTNGVESWETSAVNVNIVLQTHKSKYGNTETYNISGAFNSECTVKKQYSMQTEASRHKESSRGVHTHSLLVCVCVWYVLHTYTCTCVHTHKGNSNWSLPFGRRFLGACDVQLQRLLRLTHAHTHPCRVKSSVCVCAGRVQVQPTTCRGL